jgi:hypothetical protein
LFPVFSVTIVEITGRSVQIFKLISLLISQKTILLLPHDMEIPPFCITVTVNLSPFPDFSIIFTQTPAQLSPF